MASRGGGRAKIRPPRKGLTNTTDVAFGEIWAQIAECLTQMHTKNASHLSFEVVYRFAYKIVLKKMGETFYLRFRQFELDWLGHSVRTGLEKLCPDQLILPSDNVSPAQRRDAGNRLLKGLADAFCDHQQVMNMTTDVFMYLDRVFCNDHRFPPIYTLAMLLFKDEVLRTPIRAGLGPTLQDVLVDVLLHHIALERDGDVIDTTQMKACVYMLEGLYEHQEEKEEERLYRSVFEPRFFKASREFYRHESQKLLRQNSSPVYCQQTLQRIREEEERCRSTLSDSSKPRIVAIVEEELIQHRIADLINADTGSAVMIEHDKYDELAQVYNLISRVDPTKEELCNSLARHIMTMGEAINTPANAPAPKPAAKDADGAGPAEEGAKKKPAERINQQTVAALQWVEAVLALKDKFDRIWTQSLDSDLHIQPTLTVSMAQFINNFKRAAEYMSLYIDDNLKSSLKNKTEAEVDAALEKSVMIIQFLNDKDLFESYYKKHLSRRLIMKKTIGIDYEKQMAQRMQVQLGKSFTGKMERMFGDMAISDDLTSGYKAQMAQGTDTRAELSMLVLSHTIWPLEVVGGGAAADGADASAQLECIYPPEIERIKHSFEQFYNTTRTGRKLTWCSNMGHADMRGVFPRVEGKSGALDKERRYDFNVPTYSMIILLQFNDLAEGKSLSFDELQKRTNIPTEALQRNLQSLSLNKKTQILLRGGHKGPEIGAGDRFRVNDQFSSQFKKFKVGLVAGSSNKVETDKERAETEERTDTSRAFAIEAAIVRLMKQRKILGHAQLVSETITLLSALFKPSVPMIKARIEGLLEREYIERIGDSQYQYLA